MVPSLTEYLYGLQLDEEVVGVTKFCVHPAHWRREKPIIGGTKNLRMEMLRGLEPDLIVANKEENEKKQVIELSRSFSVYLTQISTFSDAINELKIISILCGRAKQGEKIISKILEQKKTYPPPLKKERAIYLIWKAPWMGVGGDTFIHQMMELAGFENVLGQKKRYPTLSLSEVRDLNPTYILLSSEPFPFREKHTQELEQEFPDSNILLVDGELFSWYGSRLIKSFRYFEEIRKGKRR